MDRIGKPRVRSNLGDYEDARRTFDWDRARAELSGLPEGGLNICYEAVDRHVAEGRGAKTAMRFLPRGGGQLEFSYQALAEWTNRFANLLRTLEVGPGSRVFGLAGRVPDL